MRAAPVPDDMIDDHDDKQKIELGYSIDDDILIEE